MSDFPEKENIEETTEPTLTPEEEGSTVFSDPAEHKKTAVKQKKRLLPKVIAAVLAVGVLAGGTVAVIKLIPEREEESSAPSIETISVLDMKSDDFKSVTVTNETEPLSFIRLRKPKPPIPRILQVANPPLTGILTATTGR